MLELSIRLCNSDIDNIVITEALPKNYKYKILEQELKIRNYAMVTNFDEVSCHRGIVIYARDYLSMDHIKCTVSYQEGILVSIKQGHYVLLHILAIYRSPNSNMGNNNSLLELMDEVCSNDSYSNLCILGDFILKKIDWLTLSTVGTGQDSYEQDMISCMLNNFLCQLCLEP